MRIIRSRSGYNDRNLIGPLCPVQVFVPIKGSSHQSGQILQTLLVQDYPNYKVTFIVEDKSDPAFETLENFCNKYSNAEIFFSGKASESGQKNLGLAKAASISNDDVEIFVFCDSTNSADANWLSRITYPVRIGNVEVCTTFRSFSPNAGNLAGILQALYATTIFALMTVAPKPWGGGTIIRRKTFDRLNVPQIWLKTVVDDLTLGNILDKARVKIHVSPENYLLSPLQNQSIKGFLSFLDRQILFPKFTNPWIWRFTVLGNISLSFSMWLSSCGLALYAFGNLGARYAVVGAIFWAGILLITSLLRIINKPKLPIVKSLIGIPILICVSTLISIRSIFLNHIDWHGVRYFCGEGGKVIRIENI
ncbi:MAG: glycosyltransferase family 2 protein [Pseudomonadota bacterium]